MKGVIRRYKLGYALSTILIIIGLAGLFIALWKAWPEITPNSDPLSAFWNFLWAGTISAIPGVDFKPVYLVILSVAMLVSGTAVLAFSRQWFFLPSRMMRLQCPFCKKEWTSGYDRGQVLCPHCHHLVHPKLVENP